MIHKPIQFKNISLALPHKICFQDFNAQIQYGDRIAIIGSNGSGKSTLLKLIQNILEPSEGEILVRDDVIFGYVPQIIETFESLSGGERLNKTLTDALSYQPNVLLLDEPTNHLDQNNRKSLMKMLLGYQNTLIIASHDVELIKNCTDILWHIDNQKIHIFRGNYDDYHQEILHKHSSIEHEIALLNQEKKDHHDMRMKEQTRASKSSKRGCKKAKQGHWPTLVAGGKKRQAQETAGRKTLHIQNKKGELLDRLSTLKIPEVIIPKFNLTSKRSETKIILSIQNGSIRYKDSQKPILDHINLSLEGNSRIAITGNNGCGKSTLIKAILGNPKILKTGEWHMPTRGNIGYLDQHYDNLDPSKTVLDSIETDWSHAEIRHHLNDFLFRKNEEVNALVSTLSGGEKARLSLAQIGAKTPRLLILDEMTNNLDIQTREHIIQVLQHYPSALIVISHDTDFLEKIGIISSYNISNML